MKKSAGIILFRLNHKLPEVLLVHPGGPFWAKKDEGAWSIPKGELEEGEDALKAAIREMKEETGVTMSGDFIELNPVKQKSGKVIYAWAQERDVDPTQVKSNDFEMEWPPKSGTKRTFPEIDRAAWFNMDEAKRKINMGQRPLIEELESVLGRNKL
jgi:predicted NUDIX family NTP pyrophosphohydrolase